MKVGEVKYWVARGQTVHEMLFWTELLKVLCSHHVSNGSLHCGLLEALWKKSSDMKYAGKKTTLTKMWKPEGRAESESFYIWMQNKRPQTNFI